MTQVNRQRFIAGVLCSALLMSKREVVARLLCRAVCNTEDFTISAILARARDFNVAAENATRLRVQQILEPTV